MDQKRERYQNPQVRVANFAGVRIPEHIVTPFDFQSLPGLVDEIRRYVDLPLVFLSREAQSPSIISLLKKLKDIRSPCYPHAVFVIGDGEAAALENTDIDVISIATEDPNEMSKAIEIYAQSKLSFDKTRLKYVNTSSTPKKVDILVVGAGVTGLYAANKLTQRGLTFCVIEEREIVGGIWSVYANTTSKVNTSEGAYRLLEPRVRTNRDHSSTAEILEDIHSLADKVSDRLFTNISVKKIKKVDGGYRAHLDRDGEKGSIDAKGVILAINDRVGEPRTITWPGHDRFRGILLNGISDETAGIDWREKKVVIVGMGAFAIENARTALEGDAEHVTVVCRRHGTVCPKIIDYLNFSSPYNERFEHDRKGNIRNMMLWKRLYELSGATEPECWMEKIKHTGHTISVSDVWFIAHYLKLMETVTGSVKAMNEGGVVLEDGRSIEADIVVKCVGFHRNAKSAIEISDYMQMFNNNYIDKDFMFLADAYLDDNVFNSFFGSSVLEMDKFYLEVFLELYEKQGFEEMVKLDGIEKIAIDDRRWSQYITGANALIGGFPRFYEIAKDQIDRRTANFKETHDLATYIAANKREWIDLHRTLSQKPMAEEECLPYVFEKLIVKKL